jgi:archaellum biogenesis protein FlaJ (TadC family)
MQKRESRILNWWQILVRHISIIVIGLVISSAVIGIWLILRHYHLWFSEDDIEWVLVALLPFVGLAYGGLAVKIMEKVINENDEVHWSVESGNFELFKRYAPRRIKRTVHFLLGTFSIAMTVPFMLINYQSVWTGTFILFSITFIISVYWQVATVLDDPFNEMWEIGEVKKEWKEWLEKVRKRKDKES